MKKFLFPLLSIFLISCSMYQPLVVAYKGEPLGKEKIAVLMGNESSEYFVSFLEYVKISANQPQEFENYVGIFDKQPLVVHMLPGKYSIKLECLHRRLKHISVNPSISVDIRPGYTYEIQCARASLTGKTIEASIVNKKVTETLEIPYYLK